MPAAGPQRTIRSFVLRQGRITRAQQGAFADLMPRYGLDSAQGWFDFTIIFGRDVQRTLEIGFGDGENLLALARAHPDEDFIGIEVHRPGIGHLLMGLDVEKITNVRVICADAVEVLTQCVSDASLDTVLLYFPDPWPKKRHHKRRLVQPQFAALLARKLKAGGVLRAATDWPEYAAHMTAVITRCPDFTGDIAAGSIPTQAPVRAPTKFERRGIQLGHAVSELTFRRR